MPHASLLVAPPRLLTTLAERPEFESIYHLRGERFAELPPEGILLVDLPMAPRWKPSSGPFWYEPDPEHEPTDGFARAPVKSSHCASLVFEPADIARRFSVVDGELPPEALLRYCKGLALETGEVIAWYNYLERGDKLYHDVAWVFGRAGPVELGPGITLTCETDEEELLIYNGDAEERSGGWHLWGNDRADSRRVGMCGAWLVTERFGLRGPGRCFPYNFPSYSNALGNCWEPLLVQGKL
ncbi:MAG: hypothetical protein ACPG4T_08860 [Nannocystaceae bacterium]